MNIKHCFQFCNRMVVCGLSLATLLPVPVQAQTVSWTRQLGTSSYDTSESVATDSKGNVYISGNTGGSLGGGTQGGEDAWLAKYNSSGGTQGGEDAWLAKYNSSGALVWKKQLGSSSYDYSFGVATDSKGNVYISGYTFGSLGGATQGGEDAWLAKYNTSGVLVWKKQLGSFNNDQCFGVATDSNGNVYISGATQGSLGGATQGGIDAWVAKYNTNGALLWKKQLGTKSFDSSNGVATDSKGNVYISGFTTGSLGGATQGGIDSWVAKYSSNGALVWKKQLGTSSDYDNSFGVTTDSNGNIYISGYTQGSLGGATQGLDDAWVAKYNTNGALLWKKQLGSSSYDRSQGIATDSIGNVYISGITGGSLGGANQGSWDAWVAKYSSNGSLVWKKQLGTSSLDSSEGVATDSIGNIYISGLTDGSLGGAFQGGLYDAWVAKYSQLN